MLFNNLKMALRMVADPACRALWGQVHKLYRSDRNYSMRKLFKAMLRGVAGEKIIQVGDQYLVSSFLPPLPSPAFANLITAVHDAGGNLFTQQMLAQRSAPISIYVALTERCPYHCQHCSAAGRKMGKELNTNEWVSVLRALQAMGVTIIGFTGGEPLLREDLETLVSALDDRSVSYVFTNGMGLTVERAQALKNAGLFGIGISLDATDAQRVDVMRGYPGAFDVALSAMEAAAASGLHVMAQTVVMKADLDEQRLLDLFRFAQAHGAQEVRVLEPICSGLLFQRNDADGVFFAPQDRQRLIRLQEYANRRSDLPKISVFAHIESPQRFGCGAGTQHSYISACGDLYPCDFVPLAFGNVREHSIAELWQQMNECVGIPKGQCFAMTIHDMLSEISQGQLPLPPEESRQLCLRHQSLEFPGFYRAMQR